MVARRCADSFEQPFDLARLGNNARRSFVCDVVTGFAVRFLVSTPAAWFAFVPVFRLFRRTKVILTLHLWLRSANANLESYNGV